MTAVQERERIGQGWHVAASLPLATALIIAILITICIGDDTGSPEFGISEDSRRSELTIRSATIMIRDLSDEWDASHFYEEPFEFCGKSTLSRREVKLCTEHFLGMLQDSADPQAGNETNQLLGFPTLKAYSHCTNASTFFQVKGCIKAVTRQLSLGDIVHLQHTGGTDEDDALGGVARSSVRTAQPDNAIQGLNGGVVGRSAEQSTAGYLHKLNAVGAPPPLSGCEDLGVEGCEEGSLDPAVRERALGTQRAQP